MGISIACGTEVKGHSSRKAERHGLRASPGSAAGRLRGTALEPILGQQQKPLTVSMLSQLGPPTVHFSSGCQARVPSVPAVAQGAVPSALTTMPLSGLLLF